MNTITILFTFSWIPCTAHDYYFLPDNVTRTSIPGIAAYRSALTLDWMAAEDSRQRELAAAFETEPSPPVRMVTTDCIAYERPASGKVARLMLELLKNLEGDAGTIIPELIQSLIRTKLLVETSMLDAEPDLEALVKTPGVMMGEPHTTFPRILALSWMTGTDPATTKRYGWCPINKVNKYLSVTKPVLIAKQMRALEPIVARARFIMEEFIQHVTPLNMYQNDNNKNKRIYDIKYKIDTPRGTWATVRALHMAMAYPASTPAQEPNQFSDIIDGNQILVPNVANVIKIGKLLLAALVFVL